MNKNYFKVLSQICPNYLEILILLDFRYKYGGLKIPCPKGRAGSTPASGIYFFTFSGLIFANFLFPT